MLTDLTHTQEVTNIVRQTRREGYEFLNKFAKESNYVRLTAPLVGLATACLTTIHRVATVVEIALKVFINLVTGPLRQGYYFDKGVEQLTEELPIALALLFLSPVEASLRGLGAALGILLRPVEYSHRNIHSDSFSRVAIKFI